MKKLIILAAIAFAGWKYYQTQNTTPIIEWTGSGFETPESVTLKETNTMRFRCDGRQHCSQMTSRAEAEFFTRHCPNTKMDGDRDGIPCENDSRF
ncbi:MAG: excalibur calcium-binding domain-containing protein [Marinobacter adhaerens]